MDIKELPKIIKNVKKSDLQQAIFWNSIYSLCTSSLEIYRNKKVIYPFITETLYEYYVRFNENGSVGLTGELLGEICVSIFNSQSFMLDKYGLEHLMTLFYLWQMDDRYYLFAKLYRYHYFFNFKNNKIDMINIFKEKCGIDYIAFELFCILAILLFVVMKESVYNDQFITCKTNVARLFQLYKNVIKQLTITKEKYIKFSQKTCPDDTLITFSLKVSKSYPFLEENGDVFLTMPHVLIPACSSSLLFRLTDNNNDLHSLISKEVIEEYCVSLFKNKNYYSLVSREKEFGNHSLSSDVLVVEDECLYCIEVKGFTPNHKTRFLDEDGVNKQINEVVDGMFQLYKFMFVNYPCKEDIFKNFSIQNRFSILALREDASFNRRTLYDRLFKKIEKTYGRKLTQDNQKQVIEKIKISSLEELESFAFTNTRLSQLVNHYNQEQHYYDVTAAKVVNSYFNDSSLKKYEENMDDLSKKILGLLTMEEFWRQ